MSRLLEVENANFSYGEIQTLWDVSFHVDEGEMITILGPNGAGKSTTLKMVMGLYTPTSGQITFRGKFIS